LNGCSRAVFVLQVDEAIFDAFFNSPAGYRGQYARSPQQGELANRLLISRLKGMLLSRSLGLGDFPLISRSIEAKGGKAWIEEEAIGHQLYAPPTDIVYGPWQRAAYGDHTGLIAPVGTLIEIKGGWVDGNGIERIDPDKSRRSLEIHQTGWT
jgi:hypothetical protein